MSLRAEYVFSPPVEAHDGGKVERVTVHKYDGDMFDVFDDDTGECLNEGTPFFEEPTKIEIQTWIETGKIPGRYE